MATAAVDAKKGVQKDNYNSCHSNIHKEMNKQILRAFLHDPKHKSFDKGHKGERFRCKDEKDANELVKEFEIDDIIHFSVFQEDHVEEAHEIAVQMSRKPIEQVIDAFAYLRTCYPSSPYIEHLCRVTFMEHPRTRECLLPPPEQTMPYSYFREDKIMWGLTKKGEDAMVVMGTNKKHHRKMNILPTNAKFDKERRLSWWREDLGLLNHYYNWHLSYPYPPNFPRDRQGELFAYMHQQMLARYDFERLSRGMPRVLPYGPGYGWNKPLKEGFNPKLKFSSPRSANMSLGSENYSFAKTSAEEVEKFKDRIQFAIARGFLYDKNEVKVKMTMNNLGNTLLANEGSVNKTLYGNVHNHGHLIIANANDPSGMYNMAPGPMHEDQTSPRDPVFYRWHKFIDQLFEEHRFTMDPHKVKNLQFSGVELENLNVKLEPEDYHKKKVDKPLDTKNHFYTYSEAKKYDVYNTNKDQEAIKVKTQSMDHIPYSFNMKAKNKNRGDVMVCFRVFLVPETDEPLDDWRNMFVELDKFVESFKGGETKEINRSDKNSSVIAARRAKFEDIKDGKSNSASQNNLGCGWPLNLLIPRGTKQGMRGQIFVLASDWMQDGENPQEHLHGSWSYCGQKDRKSKYPDLRPMGYPFDRLIVDKKGKPMRDLETLIDNVDNSCKTDVNITFLGAWDDENKKQKDNKKEKKDDKKENKEEKPKMNI